MFSLKVFSLLGMGGRRMSSGASEVLCAFGIMFALIFNGYVHAYSQVRFRGVPRRLLGLFACFVKRIYAFRSFGMFGMAKVRNALVFCVTLGCICVAEAAIVLLRQ